MRFHPELILWAIISKEKCFGQLELIIPIDENIMKLNKLDSNEKLNFFKNHKPVVWYCKQDGVVELFNAPGFHPETGKPLKPITKYMIKKYNLKEMINAI